MNELNNVYVKLKIGDEHCSYNDLTLRQTIYGHHTFEVNLNYNATSTNMWEKTPQFFINKYLGSNIIIRMKERISKEVNMFKGIITAVEIIGEDGDNGRIKLKGGSPTILLDGNPTMDSYTDFKLEEIIKSVLSEVRVDIETVYDIKTATDIIPYACRYNEGGYNFIHRLCSSLGEWLFYDGRKLIVGFKPDPRNERSTRLVYNKDFSFVNSSASIVKFEAIQYDYDVVNDQVHHMDGVNDLGSSYMHIAKTKSSDLNGASRYHRDMFPLADNTTASILQSADASESRIFSGCSIFSGTSITCRLRIGELILAVLPDDINTQSKDMGFIRIIEVIHTVSERGEYNNTFKGVTASAVGMPMPETIQPVVYPETASVIYNADPDNLGRVKVVFAWQKIHEKKDLTTNWIRVQTPDAGRGDSKNRGFFFVPEIGDQVMVGYELGSPERPFVMGSMFSKKNTEGAAADNNIHSIMTKSGHMIKFDDDEGGEWGITIKDKNGCSLHIDTKGKNIEITAPETMLLNAKNIKLSATESIELITNKNIEYSAGEDVVILAHGVVDINGMQETNIAGDKILLVGTQGARMHSPTTIISGNNVNIEGNTVVLKGQVGRVDIL